MKLHSRVSSVILPQWLHKRQPQESADRDPARSLNSGPGRTPAFYGEETPQYAIERQMNLKVLALNPEVFLNLHLIAYT